MTDEKVNEALELLRQKRVQGGQDRTAAEQVTRVSDPISGVSATWLAAAFRMDRAVVLRKLATCPVVRVQGDKRNSKLYDLSVAARYLVPPALTTDDFLRTLHKSDLPSALQESVWSALLKRQQWEKNAGHLWSTEDVWRVLAGLFQTIKFTTQLWVDSVDAEVGLTEAQRTVLQRLTRGLLQEVYDHIVEGAKEGTTTSQIGQVADLLKEDDPMSPSLARVQEDEFDVADLI